MAHLHFFASLLLLCLFSHAVFLSSAQECDPRCHTATCDSFGACTCLLPDSNSLLAGDRPFFGGEFCDQRRIMCDGTNSFWCQNGICNEIIQGENYTCTCSVGYSGEHCEVEGVPCGDSYCYHGAECLQPGVLCDCPANWKGSEDCSKPTVRPVANNTGIVPVKAGSGGTQEWYFPFFAGMVVVVVALIAIFGSKMSKKGSADGSQFRKLRQVQMRGFIDEDEDAFAHEPLSKADRV